MAIFALGIMPYISASIIMQLMTSVVPSLEALKKEGEQGRKIINQYTRYGTVLLAHRAGLRHFVGLENGNGIVTDPGMFFRISTVITLVGGTMFLMWLGEQITARGIGNGISLIIFAGIVAGLPSAISGTLGTRPHRCAVNSALSWRSSSWLSSSSALIVFFERAQRRLSDPVSEAPGRQPDVPGRHVAPAAEAQYVGRHSSDLRFVAAASAGDRCRVLKHDQPARMGEYRAGVAGPRPAALHGIVCGA
jgi:preprotein translocase subunit SecY